ncbi:hypothetical protein Tco_0568383 [Tanacetum coccineum]
MSMGNGTRERKPTWNNVQRVNKQNQFVTLAVQTRTGNNPVNTAKASSTNTFSTARQNVKQNNNLTSTVLKVNTVKPKVNGIRPANVFDKTHSPSSRPFKRTTVLRTNFSKQKVYIAKVKEVSTVGGKWDTAVKSSRGNKAYCWTFKTLMVPCLPLSLKRLITGKENKELAGAAKSSSTNIFSTVSTTAKASGTNFVNTVSIPVSTASANEGLSISDTTNSKEDDYEIPPLEDIHEDATDEMLHDEIQKVLDPSRFCLMEKAIGTKWGEPNKHDEIMSGLSGIQARLLAQDTGKRKE